MEDQIFGFNLPPRTSEVPRRSPCCNVQAIEIFSTIAPIGYTGVFKCSYCEQTFDPSFKEGAD